MIWRGRVPGAPNAAGLRRATGAVNRQVLTFAVTLLAAIVPALRNTSGLATVSALALSGVFALVLFCMRERWTGRLRMSWESSVQESILRTMLPTASVYVMPPAPVGLREAA